MKTTIFRLWEMLLWISFLIVNMLYAVIMTISYLITGKDYITPIAKLHDKILNNTRIRLFPKSIKTDV